MKKSKSIYKKIWVIALLLSMCVPQQKVKIAEAAEQTSAEIARGEQFNMQASTAVSFTSSNESVATVDSKGVVHGMKKGEAVITGKDSNGSEVLTCTVKVQKRGLMYSTFSMMKGEKLELQHCFSNKPGNLTWSVDNDKVAKVSSRGVVKAKAVGSVWVKGTAGEKTYACHVTVTKKEKSVIYMTFDDGPNRYSTPKVLDILKKNGVKATFFELKPAKADFDLTKRVLQEGHTLALHGYSHKYEQIYQSETIYHDNLDKLRNLFFKKFDVWCTISRFPGGSSNTVSRYNPGIMSRLSKKVGTWGYHYFDWNVSSADAGGAKNSNQVFHSIKSGLVKGRSNVILMHDFGGNDKTINALQRVIDYAKKHGFVFRPLTISTEEVHHGVNN